MKKYMALLFLVSHATKTVEPQASAIMAATGAVAGSLVVADAGKEIFGDDCTPFHPGRLVMVGLGVVGLGANFAHPVSRHVVAPLSLAVAANWLYASYAENKSDLHWAHPERYNQPDPYANTKRMGAIIGAGLTSVAFLGAFRVSHWREPDTSLLTTSPAMATALLGLGMYGGRRGAEKLAKLYHAKYPRQRSAATSNE